MVVCLCVSPATGRRPVLDLPRLLPNGSWDKLLPPDPELDVEEQGWMVSYFDFYHVCL